MRVWFKIIFAVLAIALLVWLLIRIGSFSLDILKAYNGAPGEPDPMFAEEVDLLYPAPETDGDQPAVVYEDNSANWDISVQTPVDHTAEELAEEALTGD